MAVNKRKILESAQKFLQKGALDKALKEYQTLLEVDPRDSGARLKLGDIHLRLGKKDEAIAAYLKVANQFMKDGFDAKAVALYKQIVKLAPEQVEIHVPLAELYQRLGLTSEAMAALQTATEGFQKAGRKREALELLRKAAALDPTNTTSRLKIADLLRQQGMTAEALTEYEEIGIELERSGEDEALASVYERVLEVEPDRLAALLALARVSLRIGSFERAFDLAARASTARPDLLEAFELHAEALHGLGRPDAETEPAFRHLAEMHRARGNEGRAREILQRFVPAYDLTLSGVEDLGASASDDDVPAAGGDLLEDLTQAGARLGPSLAMAAPEPRLVSTPTPIVAPAPPPAPPAPRPVAPSAAPATEADVEQLLAEAGVYLRFGKRDKAIASLESVLAHVPDHPGALERLAQAVAESGDTTRAHALRERHASVVGAGSGAMEMPTFEPDGRHAHANIAPSAAPEPVPVVVAEIPARDDDAPFELEVELDLGEGAAQEGSVEVGRPGDPHSGVGSIGIGVEMELDLDASDETDLPMSAPSRGEALEPLGQSESRRIEIPTEDELAASFDESLAVGDEATPQEPFPALGELPELQEFTLRPDPAETGDAEEASTTDTAPASEAVARIQDGAATPSVSASPKQILEDLEEADFYFQQSLLDEAEAVYRRVLEAAPTNPQALLRLGEIAASRGDDPAAGRGDTRPPLELDDTTQPGVANPEDLDATLGDDLADWESASSDEEKSGAEGLGAALEEEMGLGAEPEAGSEPALTFEPVVASDAVADVMADAERDLATLAIEPGEGIPAGEASQTLEISHFDLAAELSDALAEPAIAPLELTGEPVAEESLEAIFREFKRGVQKTLTAADHETHYDLGIAYREMGLLEDAMGEFQIALESPARHLDCLHLLGLCARDLKRSQDAIAFFRQALAQPDLGVERRAAIGFDLGIGLEEDGEGAAALEAFEQVAALDPEFPGLDERIEALRAVLQLTETPAPGEPVEAAPAEVYESFDDLIADAEAALVTSDSDGYGDRARDITVPGAAPTTSDGAPEPPPVPPRGTPPRRRKISFG